MNKGKRKKKKPVRVPFRPIRRDVGLNLVSAMRTQIFSGKAQVTNPTAKRHYFNPENIEFTGANTLEEITHKVNINSNWGFSNNKEMPFSKKNSNRNNKGFKI